MYNTFIHIYIYTSIYQSIYLSFFLWNEADMMQKLPTKMGYEAKKNWEFMEGWDDPMFSPLFSTAFSALFPRSLRQWTCTAASRLGPHTGAFFSPMPTKTMRKWSWENGKPWIHGKMIIGIQLSHYHHIIITLSSHYHGYCGCHLSL